MPDVVNPDAADDENTVVKFSTDGGVAEETPPPVEEKPKPAARVAPATGIEQLEKQLQESRRYSERVAEQARHIAAQRDQAVAYAQEAQRRGISQEELMSEQAERMAEQKIASVQAEMEALKEVQRTALEGGDWAKVTDINLKLADLGGEKNLYQRDKLIYESRRQQVQYAAQQRQQQPPVQRPPQPPRLPDDPVERAIIGRTPKTQEFIRANKDVLVRPDGTFTDVAMSAHHAAKAEGLVEDTDAYFQRLEQLVKKGKPMSAKRAPSVAAPVSRSTATMNGIPGFDGENLVMTPHMKRLAMDQLPDLEPQEAFRQWGKAYVEGVRTGRMTPITD